MEEDRILKNILNIIGLNNNIDTYKEKDIKLDSEKLIRMFLNFDRYAPNDPEFEKGFYKLIVEMNTLSTYEFIKLLDKFIKNDFKTEGLDFSTSKEIDELKKADLENEKMDFVEEISQLANTSALNAEVVFDLRELTKKDLEILHRKSKSR